LYSVRGWLLRHGFVDIVHVYRRVHDAGLLLPGWLVFTNGHPVRRGALLPLWRRDLYAMPRG
jgi:hypothetical protein